MKYLGIILFLAVAGCSWEVERLEKPKDVLSKEKMTTILTELLKIESYALAEFVQPTRYYKLMINSGDSLLNAHGVEREVFDSSFTYYGSRQDEMSAIYKEALERLNKELGEIQATPEKKEE